MLLTKHAKYAELPTHHKKDETIKRKLDNTKEFRRAVHGGKNATPALAHSNQNDNYNFVSEVGR